MTRIPAMEISDRLNLWQQLAASEVRQRRVKFVFCSSCGAIAGAKS